MLTPVTVDCDPVPPPAHLSPSSISTWQQCPLRYKYAKIDKIPEPSTSSQLLGTFTHEVLEFLYLLPAPERTPTTARRLAGELWESTYAAQVAELHLDDAQLREFRWQVWWCVEALFKLEDPTQVELAGTEQRLEVMLGDIKLLGILDRWHREPDGRAMISDYKTGKKPRPKYEGDKKFQLGVYVHLVQEALDVEVAGTELIYLKEGVRWQFDPDPQFVTGVIDTVEQVASEIATACATGMFQGTPNTLCDWCNFKVSCPAWQWLA